MFDWDISKTFEFCYGHRVWSQELDKDLALSNKPKCRHLHGHEAKVVVHLASDSLNQGMVTDFNHLNWLKVWIDENIDHKFIIDAHDPLFNAITGLSLDYAGFMGRGKKFTSLPVDASEVDRELYNSFFIVNFVPTSENLAQWIYNIVDENMPGLVSAVEWHETPKSKAVFRRK